MKHCTRELQTEEGGGGGVATQLNFGKGGSTPMILINIFLRFNRLAQKF